MSNADILFKILNQNGPDVLAIEAKIGGMAGVLKLAPHIEAIYSSSQAGGIDSVFTNCGGEVQTIVETIGVANIAALFPNFGNIWKTASAK